MADTPLVIGNVAIDQNLLAAYARASFNTKLAEYQAGFGGALVRFPASPDVIPNNQVEFPSLDPIGAAVQLDLTNTSSVDSAAAPTSNRGRGAVVSSRVPPAEFFDAAVRGYKMRPEAIAAELGRTAGLRLAERAKNAFYAMLRGAIGAVSTSSHTEDETGQTTKTAQVTDIMDAKQTLGDAMSALRVFICHSLVWNSLEKDLVTGSNYNVETLGDLTILGGIPALSGMRIVIDDDVETASVSGGTNYYSYLLGAGSTWLMPAPDSPLLKLTPNGDKGVAAWKLTGEAHVAMGVKNMDMSSNNTNPTLANLRNTSSWAEAFSHDHRDVKAAILLTQGG
jgi:hypothetical protein